MNNTYEQIADKVKVNFGFKFVEAYQSKKKGYFDLHFTFDYAIWKVITLSIDCTENDIIHRIQDALIKGSYDGEYILNPHTISLCNLIAQYGLGEAGYFTSMNTVYWHNLKTRVVQEVVDTENIKHYTVALDKDNDFIALHILTKENYYTLSHDGVVVKPSWS